MRKAVSRLTAFPGELNPKPTFRVAEILLNRRCDRGALARQLVTQPDNRPRFYSLGNRVIVATGFKRPVLNSFRRDKRSRRPGNCWRLWDGRAVPADFNLEATGLS